MGQVNLTINGRPFAVTCDDGQEGRIKRLGQYVEAKVAEGLADGGGVGVGVGVMPAHACAPN